MKRRFTRTEYQKAFLRDRKVRAWALKTAEEVRRFEIELSWKRAAYFSTIIGVLFAGYGAVLAGSHPHRVVACALGCVGLVVSLAWYLVNRGSAAWQRNWETHVDLLEGDEKGFLYKVVVDPKTYSAWRLLEPLNISPSKLTVAVSAFAVCIWAILVIYAAPLEWLPTCLRVRNDWGIYGGLLAATGLAIWLLLGATRTRSGDDPVRLVKRERHWDE